MFFLSFVCFDYLSINNYISIYLYIYNNTQLLLRQTHGEEKSELDDKIRKDEEDKIKKEVEDNIKKEKEEESVEDQANKVIDR